MKVDSILKNISGADTSVDHALENGLSFVNPADATDYESFTQEELRQRSAEVNAAREETDRSPKTIEIQLGDPNDPNHYGRGRVLNTQLFNEGVSDDLIIYNYQWNSHYGAKKGEGPVSEQQEAEYLAAAFPDKQILFINQPGFGGSSELPKEIAVEISKTGNYAPLGEYIGEKISQRLQSEMGHLAMIAVYGESLGALRAAAMTPHLTKNADTVRAALLEGPGSKEMSLLGLATNFGLKEGYHTAAYRNTAEAVDHDSAAARKESAKLKNFIRNKILVPKRAEKDRSGGKVKLSSIGRQNLGENLENLSGKGVDRVDYYSAEKSEINDFKNTNEIIKSIDPNKLDITHFVIPDASHAVAKAKPVVAEEIIRRALDEQNTA